jgi:hypothetical protein
MLNVLLTRKFRPAMLGACQRPYPLESLKSQSGKGVRSLSTPRGKFAQLVTSITVRGPGMSYA